MDGLELDFSRVDDQITRFVVEGEVVDRINALPGTPNSIGSRVDIPTPFLERLVGGNVASVNYHLIGTTIERLSDLVTRIGLEQSR